MSDSQIIQNPTWEDISNLISDFSVEQMKKQGLDLRDYNQVSAMAHKIYYYLAYKIMPLGAPWSDEKIATYNNWLINGCPKDAAHQAEIEAERSKAIDKAASRVRKDVENLNEKEKALLIRAFEGLLAQDPKNATDYDPNKICYFTLAAKHWFPAPTFCQHHIYSFLSWHRYQILDFENALRTIPGCEKVTLPYWNIETGKFPEFLQKAPFANYTFPIDVYPDYYKPNTDIGKKGTRTQRYKQFEVGKNEVNVCIQNAKTTVKWNRYNGMMKGYQFEFEPKYDTTWAIMRAHDLGHVKTGLTMANQDIAAFDPIFWFFHCNWDRLWWEWQISRNATDLDGFEATLSKEDDQRWLIDPQMSVSDPFGQHNYDSIDLLKLGILYDKPAPHENLLLKDALPLAMGPSWRDKTTGSSNKNAFTISKENINKVSLRVKGVNRICIPGSFHVVLYVGGTEIGRDAFFQSTFSGNCENCVNQAKIDFDFIFDRSLLSDEDGNPKEIKVEIINAVNNQVHEFEEIGNPTINIRMLH